MVRCFVRDRWRMVAMDDSIPVDALGQPLLVRTQPPQLWPLLLSMAVLKVMAAYEVCTTIAAPSLSQGFASRPACSHAAALVQVLELSSPHEVPPFHWLTGWMLEDVLPVAPHRGAAQEQATVGPSLLLTVLRMPCLLRCLACRDTKNALKPDRERMSRAMRSLRAWRKCLSHRRRASQLRCGVCAQPPAPAQKLSSPWSPVQGKLSCFTRDWVCTDSRRCYL